MKNWGFVRAVFRALGYGLIMLFSQVQAFAETNYQSVTVDSSGNVGQYASIALDSKNVPHISYYDASAKDLKYATLNGENWIIVAVDQGGDVGQYSAITVDSRDTPHISYYDATNGNLKYATKSGGTWVSQIVDSSPYDLGLYTSIVTDILNHPYISYFDKDNEQLKLAYMDPNWNIRYGPTARIINGSTSIALHPMAVTPIIAYFDVNDRTLKLALYDRGGSLPPNVTDGNGWGVEVVTASNTWMEDVQLIINSAGEPCLCYIDLTSLNQVDLKYARKQCLGSGCLTMVTADQPTGQGTWSFEVVDSSPTIADFADIALDSNGIPHISYYAWCLKYATKVNNAWTVVILDDSGDVGRYASIAVDANRRPHICYYDQGQGDLKYVSPFREKMCFPPNRGVPGHPEPPLLDGKVREDLGWYGAMRLTYGDGSASPHVAFQSMRDNAQPYIYLSFEVRNDPTFDSNDVIVLNFRSRAYGGTPADDRRIFIYPLCDNTGAAGPGCDLVTPDDKIDRPPRDVKAWKNSAAWTPLAAGQPVNLGVKVRSFPDGSTNSWNVEVRVPVTIAAGGSEWIDFNDDFLFYFNVIRVSTLGGTIAASEFRWPRNAPEVGGSLETYPFPPDDWGMGLKSAMARCKGVWMEWNDVWTGNDPPHTIAVESPPNTKVNNFYARVRNDTEVNGTPEIARSVRARFRIANWGIPGPGDWADIPAANPGCPDTSYQSNPTCLQDVPAATSQNPGTSIFNLRWKVSDSDVPNYQAHLHQCVLVELDSLSDARIISRSVYRNMDFVSASKFTREASISSRGYGPPPEGNSEHKFLLHVTAKNDEVSITSKQKTGGMTDKGTSILTWIAHGYRQAGDYIIIRGKRYALVNPAGSFGYVVKHQGRVKEWRHRLINAEEIVPNFYSLSIPPNDEAVVTTEIEPQEYSKRWSVGIFAGYAFPLGTHNASYDAGINALGGAFYQASPRLSLAAIYGYNKLNSNSPMNSDTSWMNMSANLRYRLLWINQWSAYIGTGPGLYIPRSGNTKFGYNLGLGLDYEYNDLITLEAGLDFHASFDSDIQFLHAHAGVIFRF